jgi:hypothetical protein
LEKNLGTASTGLFREHGTIVAGYDKERLVLIDAAEQLNFLPVQDCVHIDSIAAQSIRPNSSALSEMSCGDMEIDGVVVRILVYRILSGSVLSLGRCHRAQKRIARTKDIFIACVVISTFGEVIFYQDFRSIEGSDA